MTGTAAEIDPRLIAFMLPSVPESVRIARFHIRAALSFHDLGEYADDAEIITSELVANAIQHAYRDVTETIGVTLARTGDQDAVIVIVSDSSPHDPVIRTLSTDSEFGRGLRIVEELSACWGWHPEPGGKAVYAILAQEAGTWRRDGTARVDQIAKEEAAIAGVVRSSCFGVLTADAGRRGEHVVAGEECGQERVVAGIGADGPE
jgi:serine/threonine-protein kinase RsbW